MHREQALDFRCCGVGTVGRGGGNGLRAVAYGVESSGSVTQWEGDFRGGNAV